MYLHLYFVVDERMRVFLGLNGRTKINEIAKRQWCRYTNYWICVVKQTEGNRNKNNTKNRMNNNNEKKKKRSKIFPSNFTLEMFFLSTRFMDNGGINVPPFVSIWLGFIPFPFPLLPVRPIPMSFFTLFSL